MPTDKCVERKLYGQRQKIKQYTLDKLVQHVVKRGVVREHDDTVPEARVWSMWQSGQELVEEKGGQACEESERPDTA